MSNLPPPPPDDSSWSPPPPAAPPPYQGPQATKGQAMLGTGETVQLASAGSRLGARIIDALIVTAGIVILVIVGLLAVFGIDSDDSSVDEESASGVLFFLAVTAIAALIGILYEVTMIAVKGQTLGKMATRIKVVRADNGLVPGWGKSFGRWVIPALLSFVPAVGPLLSLLVYLWLLWDNNRQGLHDKAAGTLVIKS